MIFWTRFGWFFYFFGDFLEQIFQNRGGRRQKWAGRVDKIKIIKIPFQECCSIVWSPSGPNMGFWVGPGSKPRNIIWKKVPLLRSFAGPIICISCRRPLALSPNKTPGSSRQFALVLPNPREIPLKRRKSRWKRRGRIPRCILRPAAVDH